MKRVIALLLLALIILATASTVGVGFYLSPQDELAPADAIVVISGGETALRVKEGVSLYQSGWAPLIIMSGAARDEGIANAVSMKQMAINLGVPADSILVEPESINTFENATLVRKIIKEQKASQIILVTSPYHQRRASIVFHKALSELPVTIINHSALDSAWRKNGWWMDGWARRLTTSELKKIVYTQVVPFQYQK